MAKDVSYESLKKDFDYIVKKSHDSSRENHRRLNILRRSRGELNDVEKIGPFEIGDEKIKRGFEYKVYKNLANFSENLSKGDFSEARYNLGRIESEINRFNRINNDEKLNIYFSEQEREILVEGINMRIKKGMGYLKKNPSYEKMGEMERILEYSKDIEDKLKKISLDSKKESSNLEKTLGIVSIAFVLAGMFFLSPNLTGNVIGNLTKNSSDISGGLLFIIGILGVFLTLKGNFFLQKSI